MAIHDQARGSELPKKITGNLDKVWAYLRANGANTGHNVVVYRDYDRATGVMTIDVGVQVESALPSNRRHLERAIQSVLELPGRIGILGLTFKENVSDLRNSRVPDILRELAQFGIDAVVHDPFGSPDVARRTRRRRASSLTASRTCSRSSSPGSTSACRCSS